MSDLSRIEDANKEILYWLENPCSMIISEKNSHQAKIWPFSSDLNFRSKKVKFIRHGVRSSADVCKILHHLKKNTENLVKMNSHVSIENSHLFITHFKATDGSSCP